MLFLLGRSLIHLTMTVVVYDLLGTGAALAGYYAIMTFPRIVLSPVAGLLADSMDKRGLLIALCLLSAGAGFLLGSAPGMLLALCAVAMASAAFTVSEVTVFAAVPGVMEPGHLVEANALLSAAESTARILTPAVSTFLVLRLGTTWGFRAAAVLYLLAAACLLAVRLPFVAGDRSVARRNLSHAWWWVGARSLLSSRLLGAISITYCIITIRRFPRWAPFRHFDPPGTGQSS